LTVLVIATHNPIARRLEGFDFDSGSFSHGAGFAPVVSRPVPAPGLHGDYVGVAAA
jgi:hypothetical protein